MLRKNKQIKFRALRITIGRAINEPSRNCVIVGLLRSWERERGELISDSFLSVKSVGDKVMDSVPIYYRPMSSQQQQATAGSPFRDLLRHMLHEELNTNPNLHHPPALQHRRREAPEKWSKTFRLDNYLPDEVKVVVKDGCVRVNAKHVGGDENNSDVRESTRTIRIPEGVDQGKIHCFLSSENHYTVEGPVIPDEDEQELQVPLEGVPAITDGSDVDMKVAEGSMPYQESLDLSVFDPDHISITRRKNVVSVSADQNSDENGIRVQRSFRKAFTLPEGVDYKQVKAARGADGKVAIMAPRVES